jgi:hypothetical protein
MYFNSQKAIVQMLDVYAEEIIYRLKQQQKHINTISYSDPEEVLYLIVNAIKILNIVSPGRTKIPKRTNERLMHIKSNFGNIPLPPKEFRNVRNKIEHFDEYIEEWFSTTGGDFAFKEETTGFIYRYDPSNGGIFYYLEHELRINDVVQWVEEVANLAFEWKKRSHRSSP